MQIGMNVMLWTASPGPEHGVLFEKLRAIGYDLVELPVFAPADFPAAVVLDLLDEHGLGVTCSGALPPHSSLIAESDDEARLATDYMMRSIDVCASSGGTAGTTRGNDREVQ